MPTITAPAVVQAKRNQLQPMFLLQIDFTFPSAFTLYLCDGSLSVAKYTALGHQWSPAVKSWGTLQAALGAASISDVSGGPTTAQITLLNDKRVGGKARFTDLVRSSFNTGAGTYEPMLAKATVYWLFAGLDSPDQVKVHEFYLDDFQDGDLNTVVLRMSTLDASIDKRQLVTTIDAAKFPLSDPEARGGTIPTVFGFVQNVPTKPIVAGGFTYSQSAVSFAGGTVTLNVVNTATFPQAGTFQALYHDVTMTLRVLNATQFTLVNATANFTIPVGGPILELRAGAKAYRYVVAENRGALLHGAVTNVRVSKIPQPAGLITIDLNDTTLVSGKSFVVVNFAIPPTRLTQIAQGLAVPTTTSRITIVRPSVNLPVTVIANARGNATIITPPAPVRVSTTAIPGTIAAVRRSIRFRITSAPSKVTAWKITRSTPAANTVLFQGTTTIPVGDVKTADWGSGVVYGNEGISLSITCPAGATGAFRIDIDTFQERIDTDVLTPNVGDNTLADVVIGAVTCDVEGLHDDGAGTITGTPNALIQTPADCVAAILTGCYSNVAAAALGSSFAPTRTSQVAAALVWAFVFDVIRFADLRRKAGEQGRAILYLDAGKFEYFYLVDAPTADITLDFKNDLWAGGKHATLTKTPRTEVVTRLTTYAQLDPTKAGSGPTAYIYSRTQDDNTYVSEVLTGTLELDWVQDQPTADALHTFSLGRRRRQRWQTEFVTYPDVLSLAGVAHVALKNHPLLVVHGDTALIWRVQNRDYQMADANPTHIRLQLIEANS